MRLGIVGSSGGAALQAAARCLGSAARDVEFVVIADRECGLLRWAQGRPGSGFLIPYQGAVEFSEAALDLFHREGVRQALLFYTRRVAAPLIERMEVCNIHPSLLPDFPGLGAVRQAHAAGARLLGATLHRVNEGLDTGPILARIAHSLPPGATLREAEKISFLQKAWLTLLWCERARSGASPASARPDAGAALDPALLESFEQVRAREAAELGFSFRW